jgi:hypothetical protein
MSDPLNTLGFLSWGLLGSGDGVEAVILIQDLDLAISLIETLECSLESPVLAVNINVDRILDISVEVE